MMKPYLRVLLTLSLPFVLAWAYLAELGRGIHDAFRSAWLEVRCNLEAYHRLMDSE